MKTGRTDWTPELRAEIERRYPHERTDRIAADLGIPVSKIYARANDWGLKKTAEYMASPESCRLRRDENPGVAYRFQRGHVPANKGLNGITYPGMEKTQFKPGHKPKNWQPVGAERLMDGYLQRKMTDTGCTRRDYVPVHHLVWTKHHGGIPAGHCIIFLDGDRRNLKLENLACITREENMKRNSIHNLPPELKKAAQLNGSLKKRITHAERKQK